MIVGTSEIKEAQTLKTGFENGEEVPELKYSGAVLSYNYLFVTRDDTKQLTIEKFHYPYTNIELMIPKDKDGFVTEFVGFANDSGATKETYNGWEYIVEKPRDSMGAFEVFNKAQSSGLPLTKEEVHFSSNVNVGSTIDFENHPVILRYTYKGETVYTPLYTLEPYTFKGPSDLGVYFNYSPRSLLAGDTGSLEVYASNSAYEDQYPMDRKNVQFEIAFPFEIQPEKITKMTLQNEQAFEVSYWVKSKDGSEIEKKSSGKVKSLEFDLEADEYITKIQVLLPQMPKNGTFWFYLDIKGVEKDKNGDPILKDIPNLSVTAKINYENPDGKEQFKEKTKTLKLLAQEDGLKISRTGNGEVYLDEKDEGYFYGGYVILDGSYRMMTYENVKLEMVADPQIMSKIDGILFQRSNVSGEPEYCIEYTTNQGTKSISGNLYYSNSGTSYNDVKFDLQEGEYVTGIVIKFPKLVKSDLYRSNYSATYISPLINTSRTYFDAQGQEQPIAFDQPFQYHYAYSTDTKSDFNGVSTAVSVTYKSDWKFNIKPGYNTYGLSAPSAFRGATFQLKGVVPFVSATSAQCSSLYDYYRDSHDTRALDPLIYYKNAIVYLEVDRSFEVQKLNHSSKLLLRKDLANGHRLYVFEILEGQASLNITADMYVRPDAPLDTPTQVIYRSGVCFEKYLNNLFPGYPNSVSQYPYQKVVLTEIEGNSDFPGDWGLDENQKKLGYCQTYPDTSQKITVLPFSSGSEQMSATLDEAPQGNSVNFKEQQRNELGFVAFVGAPDTSQLADHTSVFLIPEKGDSIKGPESKETAQYTLYATAPMKIMLKGEEVNLTEKGITISYFDKNGEKIDASEIEESIENVRKIEIFFNNIEAGAVYELSMPLRADLKQGTDTSDWTSYIGSYNTTGSEGKEVYLPPLQYVYSSYSFTSRFGLDKNETGTYLSQLGTTAFIRIYDEADKLLFNANISKGETQKVIAFNTIEGAKPAYFVFGFENSEDDTRFLPTRAEKSGSDITDANKHVQEDGRIVWYLSLDMEKLVQGTATDHYDAFFVRLPEVIAQDLLLNIGEEKTLPCTVSQPANSNIVSSYQVQAVLTDSEPAIAQITGDYQNNGYKAIGLSEGTVAYTVTVTNKQGMKVSATGNIIVGEQNGTLKIEKVINPDNQTGVFSFKIESTKTPEQVWYMHANGAGPATVDGSTDKLTLPAGQYIVTELSGLSFDSEQTTVSVDGTVQQDATITATVDIAGDKTTAVCFTNTVASCNIPNDSSAVVNGMKPEIVAGEKYTLFFEQKKELGQAAGTTTSN